MAMVVTDAAGNQIRDLADEGDDEALDTLEDGDHTREVATPLRLGIAAVKAEEEEDGECGLEGSRDNAM